MKNMYSAILISCVTAVLTSCSGGDNATTTSAETSTTSQEKVIQTQLAAPTENDITTDEVVQPDFSQSNLANINTNKESVSFSYVVDNRSEIQTQPTGYEEQSRAFKLSVSGSELNKGISLPVTSKSALIRIQPKSSAKGEKPIAMETIEIEQGGIVTKGDQAFEIFVSGEELQAAGIATDKSTSAMQMKSSFKPEPVTIRSKSTVSDKQYFVHVQEKNSNKVLVMATKKPEVLQGEELDINLQLEGLSSEANLNYMNGNLVSPEGKRYPVELTQKDGAIRLKADTTQAGSAAPGLWELQTSVEYQDGATLVRRDGRLAFALSAKTARYNSDVNIHKISDSNSFKVELQVETYTPGRYEASVMVTGAESESAIQVMAAKWLDASDTITLTVDEEILSESGISAPYQLRNLTLKDQTRMSTLWVQSEVLTVD